MDVKEELINQIRKSKKAKIEFYKKKDLIEHVGLEIKLTEMEYTIDFGINQKNSLIEVVPISAVVSLIPWKGRIAIKRLDESKNIEEWPVTHVIDISDESSNLRFCDFVQKKVLDIKMEKYHLIKNNCRDHVEKSINEIMKEYPNKFYQYNMEILENLREKDKIKIASILVAFTIIMVLIVLIVKNIITNRIREQRNVKKEKIKMFNG